MEAVFDPFSGKLSKLRKLIMNSDSIFSPEIEANDNVMQQMVISILWSFVYIFFFIFILCKWSQMQETSEKLSMQANQLVAVRD